ncbi:MAG: ABC transporter substrate-binding protein [Candidatus Odinarchaeota archaeon]
MLDKMKYHRLITICIIILFAIQVVPINSSNSNISKNNSELLISQRIESSTNFVPPEVLKYISQGTSIDYDMIQNYSSYLSTIIFDPLVEYSFESEDPIPALAKQWVVSNDSKHWIFTLRDDVTFHDGTKFNASSVKFTYDRFIDSNQTAYAPNPIAELSEMPLESVEIIDEYKVSINFNQSYAPFIYQEAAFCPISSPNSFEGGPDMIVPIGTGPYYLDVGASNATFQRFIRNDQHFRGVPPFEEVQWTIYSSEDDFQAAFKAHDGSLVIPIRRLDPLPENDNYWEKSLGFDTMHFGVFNHLNPILDDPNVRLAINYAINKTRYINQDYGGVSESVKPQRSVIFSGDLYHDESIQGYPYNVKLANSILNNTGYIRLGDGYRFDIEIASFARNYDKLLMIKEDLDLVGIRANIIIGNITDLEMGNFDIFLTGWAPLMDPSITRMLLSTSGPINWGHYSNSEIDLYTNLGQQTPVRQEREYYYFQVQQIAQEDAPLLLMMETKRIYWRAKNVTPFIKLSKDSRLVFNYTTQRQDTDIYTMDDIEVSSDAIYFPFTDGLVSLKNQRVESTMTMTHELGNLIPGQQKKGKFYEFQVNNSDLEYQIRCYYDLDEIDPSNQHKEQEIFQWNFSTQSWKKLEIIDSNINLRFSEVQIKGSAILRLSEINLILLTFRYLPIILIVVGPIIVLTSLILNKNRKFMKEIKNEYE